MWGTCIFVVASLCFVSGACPFNLDCSPPRLSRSAGALARRAAARSPWRAVDRSTTAAPSIRRTSSQTSHDGELSRAAKERATVEILNVLFPPSPGSGDAPSNSSPGASYEPPGYAQRVRAGREAQGYTTTSDAVAARMLVPARELTYGEYDLGFFSFLIEECLSIRARVSLSDRRALEAEARKLCFGDIGSGCGRLVVAQALMWPWRSCRGVEKVPSLHDMGEAALAFARLIAADATAGRVVHEGSVSPEALQLLEMMSPSFLSLGDINEPEVDVADMDILFCYSSSFPAYGDLLTEFSYTLGHKLRPGAQVITTDRRLVSDGPWEFALLGEREGPNPETGGKSTAYLWEVVKSALWGMVDCGV